MTIHFHYTCGLGFSPSRIFQTRQRLAMWKSILGIRYPLYSKVFRETPSFFTPVNVSSDNMWNTLPASMSIAMAVPGHTMTVP